MQDKYDTDTIDIEELIHNAHREVREQKEKTRSDRPCKCDKKSEPDEEIKEFSSEFNEIFEKSFKDIAL